MVQKTDKRGGTIVASPAAVAAAVAEAMPPAKKAKVSLPAYATQNRGSRMFTFLISINRLSVLERHHKTWVYALSAKWQSITAGLRMHICHFSNQALKPDQPSCRLGRTTHGIY